MQTRHQDFLARLGQALELPPGSLSEATRLDDGLWDSLAIMAAISLMDEMFGRVVPARQLAECQTIGGLLDLVDSREATGSFR